MQFERWIKRVKVRESDRKCSDRNWWSEQCGLV